MESEINQQSQPNGPNIPNRFQSAARLYNRDAHQLASALLDGVLRLKLAAAPREGSNEGGDAERLNIKSVS
ncbi:hypothetical protein BDR22DRAFT_194131 [Usnea florida]